MGTIAGFLGDIIHFIYKLVNNYGVAIILFTLLVRIILLPLNIKQQKSMARTQKISPLLAEIQNKYKNDKEKQSKETMKLYQKYKISPMAGCLPMLVQFPILIALIWVIYDPGWYMFGLDTAQALEFIKNGANITQDNINLFGQTWAEAIKNAAPVVEPLLDNALLAKLTLAVEVCDLKAVFCGINLVEVPSYRVISLAWIFPLLSTAATYLSGKMTQNQTTQTSAANDQSAQTGKMMTSIMPIMTLFFTFTMPVAASFYWFVSSSLQIIQTWVLKKVIKIEDLTTDDGGTWHERNSKKRKNG